MSYKYRVFGWKKDKYDKRDYIYPMKRGMYTLPEAVDLSALLPEMSDQGYLGACAGFSFSNNLSGCAKQQNVFTERFSPKWIYNGARFLDGTLTEDSGAYPRDCLKWLKMKGGLLEHFWPYSDKLDPTPPPTKFDPEAKKYPVLEYFRVTSVADICACLADGHLVSFGTPWYDEWMDCPPDGKLPIVTDKSICGGGHATLCYGYDVIRNVFLCMNSWGKGWGNSGLFTMPMQAFSVFAKDGGWDAYYVNVEWRNVTPEPVPVKKGLKWYWWLAIIAGVIGGLILLF